MITDYFLNQNSYSSKLVANLNEFWQVGSPSEQNADVCQNVNLQVSNTLSYCKNCFYVSLGFDPWVRKIPWRRKWQPTPAFLPGKSHGLRSLGYSPCGRKESDTTERLHSLTHSVKYQNIDSIRKLLFLLFYF